MIKGLYEAHLQVKDLTRSIEFYQKIGLKLAYREDEAAFMWVVPRQSWIGLWQSNVPGIATSHLAFWIDYADMKGAITWLRDRGIEPVEFKGLKPLEPIARPSQANCSVYFDDPDGNSLELICNLPSAAQELPKMYLSEWEKTAKKN